MTARKICSLQKIVIVLVLITVFVVHFSPISAAEERNVDSFDVHPENRWEITDTSFSSSVENSYLRMYDTGDGTKDYYKMDRELRDPEGTIELRVKIEIEAGQTTTGNGYYIHLGNPADSTARIYLHLLGWDDAGTPDNVIFVYYKDDDTTESYTVPSGNKPTEGYWYTYRIKYNLLKSEFEIRCTFDNGTRLFNIEWQDAEEFEVPSLFGVTSHLSFSFWTRSEDSGIDVTTYLDYVDAQFKERSWVHNTVPSDANYLLDSVYAAQVEDACDEISTYRLTVPALDSVSGDMNIYTTDHLSTVGDYLAMSLIIYSVNATDGTLDEEVGVWIAQDSATGAHEVTAQITDNNVIKEDIDVGTAYYELPIAAHFSINLQDSRDTFIVRVTFKANATYTFALVYTSSITAGNSDEFVIEIKYDVALTQDVESSLYFGDISVVDRSAMLDTGGFIDGFDPQFFETIGKTGGDWDPLAALIRWLGGLLAAAFRTVGDLIIIAVEALQPIITAVQTAVDGLVAYIQAIGADVIDYLITVAGDVLEALIDAAVVLTDAITEAFFLIFWDSWSGPDLLQWIDWGLTGIIQAVDGGLEWVIDFTAQLQSVWDLGTILGLIFFFGIPLLASPTIGLYLDNMFSAMVFDITFGVSPFGVIPRIPAVAIWLVVLQLNVLDGTAFGGFLTW